jgi:hypothetical protein
MPITMNGSLRLTEPASLLISLSPTKAASLLLAIACRIAAATELAGSHTFDQQF